MYAIQVKQVSKQYHNGMLALDAISLTVQQGEIFSLLGQNGAGKSTLIKILTTYLQATSGTVTMLNQEVAKDGANIRSQIACVSQKTSIDSHLSLEENMMFQSKLYRIPKDVAKQRMKSLIKNFGLERYLSYPVSSYSGGVKRRLDIALNLMSNPRILFLDEPTVGMDIQSRKTMWDMVKKIRDELGTTIFLTTHYLEEAEQLSDTICIMKEGKEVIQGSAIELRKKLHNDIVEMRFENGRVTQQAFQLFHEQLQGQKMDIIENTLRIYIQLNHKQFEQIHHLLLDHNISFQALAILEPTLEDVFLQYTSIQEVVS